MVMIALLVVTALIMVIIIFALRLRRYTTYFPTVLLFARLSCILLHFCCLASCPAPSCSCCFLTPYSNWRGILFGNLIIREEQVSCKKEVKSFLTDRVLQNDIMRLAALQLHCYKNTTIQAPKLISRVLVFVGQFHPLKFISSNFKVTV